MTLRTQRCSVALAALAAFAAALFAGFLFDDVGLLNDAVITSPSGWLSVWGLRETRPLTWFTFWANYHATGETPLSWHAVNLALHVAAALLLFEFLREWLPARAAWFGALVFAVHPAMAEPVAYVFARATLLAAVASLAAMLAWVRGRPWLAAALFFAAMLGKEECAAVPLVLLLLDWLRNKQIPWPPLAAMLATAIALGLRVVWAAAVVPGSQAGAQAGISPLAYLATQGVSILGYLRRMVLPWGFSIDPGARPAELPYAVLAWLAVLALCVWAARSAKGWGAWFLAGMLLLAPSSSILPAADLAADRRMYLPMIAFSALAGLLLDRAGPKIAALVIVALFAISVRYAVLWQSPEALWTEAVRLNPENVRAKIQLARSIEPARALTILHEAEQLDPSDSRAFAEEGRILLQSGHPAEALGAFGKALAIDPNDAKSINNRGAALLALGQRDAAKADFERALAKDACLFDARRNLKQMGEPIPDTSNCVFTPRQKEALGMEPGQ